MQDMRLRPAMSVNRVNGFERSGAVASLTNNAIIGVLNKNGLSDQADVVADDCMVRHGIKEPLQLYLLSGKGHLAALFILL